MKNSGNSKEKQLVDSFKMNEKEIQNEQLKM